MHRRGMEDALFQDVSVPGAACHKGFDDADAGTLHAVFARAVRALEACEIPYVVIGGLASAALGRPRASGDIDILVTPHDARRALEVLADAGFETEETNPHWIFKAVRDGALVDLLFKMKGDIYLDDEMLARSPVREVHGHPAHVIPREDLVVVKALAHDEESSRHWFDALGIVALGDLDWDYLIRRAAKGRRRVLSLLLYATSVDLVVPPSVIRRLHEDIFTDAEEGA
jgi:predicted nucleotidyltransferase